MPAASSGASSPRSVAATAGGRMGDASGDKMRFKTRAFIRREGAETHCYTSAARVSEAIAGPP
jgi:hypothetical protein